MNQPIEESESTARSSKSRGKKVAAIASVGAILSAIIASACCWLPLVLIALGASGAGIAAGLEAYRPLLMVVTLGFLGAAFYLTYRPRKGVAGHGCCTTEAAEDGSCCPTSRPRRFGLTTLNKAMLWGVTFIAVAFLFFPSYVGLLFGSDDRTVVAEGAKRAVVEIRGMTCEGCAAAVSQAIRRVPGVQSVEVDYGSARATIVTDACCPIPSDEIILALERAGYDGAFVETGNGQGTGSIVDRAE